MSVLDRLSGKEPKREDREKDLHLKVALLPDYRSKTLYLASLVDAPGVRSLLHGELVQRLQEMISDRRKAWPETFSLPSPPMASIPTPPVFSISEQEKENDDKARVKLDSNISTPFPTKTVNFADIDEDDFELSGSNEAKCIPLST